MTKELRSHDLMIHFHYAELENLWKIDLCEK